MKKRHSELTKAKIKQSCLRRNFSEEETVKRIEASVRATSKMVICNETKQVFNSESDAARAFDVSPNSISKCCRGILHTVKNLTFRFY